MANDSEPLKENEEVTEAEPAAEKTGSSGIALTIALLALILWFGFQAFQFVKERSDLRLLKGNQEMAMQESEKILAQFQTLVTQIGGLAKQGHAGAKMVMDELQKTGVRVAPDEKPAEKPETKTKSK